MPILFASFRAFLDTGQISFFCHTIFVTTLYYRFDNTVEPYLLVITLLNKTLEISSTSSSLYLIFMSVFCNKFPTPINQLWFDFQIFLHILLPFLLYPRLYDIFLGTPLIIEKNLCILKSQYNGRNLKCVKSSMGGKTNRGK